MLSSRILFEWGVNFEPAVNGGIEGVLMKMVLLVFRGIGDGYTPDVESGLGGLSAEVDELVGLLLDEPAVGVVL